MLNIYKTIVNDVWMCQVGQISFCSHFQRCSLALNSEKREKDANTEIKSN